MPGASSLCHCGTRYLYGITSACQLLLAIKKNIIIRTISLSSPTIIYLHIDHHPTSSMDRPPDTQLKIQTVQLFSPGNPVVLKNYHLLILVLKIISFLLFSLQPVYSGHCQTTSSCIIQHPSYGRF